VLVSWQRVQGDGESTSVEQLSLGATWVTTKDEIGYQFLPLQLPTSRPPHRAGLEGAVHQARGPARGGVSR
jgi:hypothetical protein